MYVRIKVHRCTYAWPQPVVISSGFQKIRSFSFLQKTSSRGQLLICVLINARTKWRRHSRPRNKKKTISAPRFKSTKHTWLIRQIRPKSLFGRNTKLLCFGFVPGLENNRKLIEAVSFVLYERQRVSKKTSVLAFQVRGVSMMVR